MYNMYEARNRENDNFNFPNAEVHEILRGEIAATKAYEQVLEKVKSDPESYRLREFKLDHDEAVDYWRKQVLLEGEYPDETASIWGTVVETFVGISKLLGEEAALKMLYKGEEHGVSTYEKMLDSDLLTNPQKREVRNTFLPRQRNHIRSIEAMLKLP